MREILFRGKRTDNGEWVYGDLTHSVYKIGDTCVGKYGCEIGMHQVDPSTVGQYTGLTDKNGKRIFEGDVVEYREYGNLAVVWDDGAFQLMREDTFYDMLDRYTSGISTVVGNRWDNPELLGAHDGGPED